MQEFKVMPCRSIGPIRLGMGRDEVRRILGEPSSVEVAHEKWGIPWPDRDFFFNNGFQVSYANGTGIRYRIVRQRGCGLASGVEL